MIPCERCGREIPKRWYHWLAVTPLCGPESDAVQRCVEIGSVMRREPPEEVDYDQPPDDIDICGICDGSGEVFLRQDWATGAYITEDCRACGGSGFADPLCYIPLEWK